MKPGSDRQKQLCVSAQLHNFGVRFAYVGIKQYVETIQGICSLIATAGS